MRPLRVILFVVFFIVRFSYASITETIILHPSGQLGLVDCYSARTLGFSKLALGVSGNFAYDGDFVRSLHKKQGFTETVTEPFSVLYGIYHAIAFGATDYLDISAVLPIYFDYLDPELPTGGSGDLDIALKFRIPGNRRRVFDGALLANLSLATGAKERGYFTRHGYYFRNTEGKESFPVAYYSAREPTCSFKALGTYGNRTLSVHGNLGVCLTFDRELDNALTGAIGVEYTPVEWAGIHADVYAEPRFEHVAEGFRITKDPFHFSPGVTFRAPGGTNLSIGSSFRLSSVRTYTYRDRTGTMTLATRTEPFWKLYFQLSWNGFLVAGDRDGDLVRDRDDSCPDVPEDPDNFDDIDGCPDADNDQDRIPDDVDSCPRLAEDMDGFEDEDGCPDPDNDVDMVPDSADRCPNEPEDRDGYSDTDGCPDLDNDEDGILDTADRCMNLREDLDGFEDGDGCPDLDNDSDAIPDSVDKCPDSSGVPDLMGCPQPREKAKEIQYGRLILSRVRFEAGSAELTPGSSEDLDRVYQSLLDWPQATIEIQAHSDNSAPAKTSLKLTQQMAENVREYLIRKGIDPSRLTAAGKGGSTPIADNATVKGRLMNSRVEIHRTD